MDASDPYKAMLKDIIRSQIQHLIDQLSNAGEESVLLTACLSENDHGNPVIGSHLGKKFFQVKSEYQKNFKNFCIQTIQDEVQAPQKEVSEDTHISDTPVIINSSNKPVKRPLSTNGTDNDPSDNSQQPEPKRKRFGTLKKVDQEMKDATPNKAVLIDSETDSPSKGQHKCCFCSYTSKFKANVSRHERSIHNLSLDGGCSPSVHYACTLCQYKSQYRSNLMRHEKTVHKLESTNMEIESRKISVNHSDQEHENFAAGFESQTEDSQGSELSFTDTPETSTTSTDHHAHICSYCQQMCLTIQDLRSHIESVHLGNDRHTCESCGKKCDSIVTLQDHITSTHGTRRNSEKCACGKTFQYRASLMRHEKRCMLGKEPEGRGDESGMGTGEGKRKESNRVKKEIGLQDCDGEKMETGTSEGCFGTKLEDNSTGTSHEESSAKSQVKPEHSQDISDMEQRSSQIGLSQSGDDGLRTCAADEKVVRNLEGMYRDARPMVVVDQTNDPSNKELRNSESGADQSLNESLSQSSIENMEKQNTNMTESCGDGSNQRIKMETGCDDGPEKGSFLECFHLVNSQQS